MNTEFDTILALLKKEKNVVLLGAPGLGKTCLARRLASALTGSTDPQQVEMIQSQQAFLHEDFINGFPPPTKGHFDLKYGPFPQFCLLAQRHESQRKPHVLIVDEIDRVNLGSILGELLALVEKEKRGKEHAIPLANSQDSEERFYIPKNLHIIGMTTTPDLSLLRLNTAVARRFVFIDLRSTMANYTKAEQREIRKIENSRIAAILHIIDRARVLAPIKERRDQSDFCYELVKKTTLSFLRFARDLQEKGEHDILKNRHFRRSIEQALNRDDLDFFVSIGRVLAREQKPFSTLIEDFSLEASRLEQFLIDYWVEEIQSESLKSKPLCFLSMQELRDAYNADLSRTNLDPKSIDTTRRRLGLKRAKIVKYKG